MSTPEKNHPDQKTEPQQNQAEPVKDPKQQGDNDKKPSGSRLPG
ncbi:hypothetical protein Q0601_00555 [Paracoccus onubensis]|nr:hypothetical protein [Paracoccus onubensis]MDP0925652.1 hypothetical protein [Paracoccus onubensis]